MSDARQSSTAPEGMRAAARDPFARAPEELWIIALALLWSALQEGKRPRRSKLDQVLAMYRTDPEDLEFPSIPEEIEALEPEAIEPTGPGSLLAQEEVAERFSPTLDVVPVLFGELMLRALLESDHGEALAAALAIVRGLHAHSGPDRDRLLLRSACPVLARPHITAAPTRGSPLRGSAASDGPDLEE